MIYFNPSKVSRMTEGCEKKQTRSEAKRERILEVAGEMFVAQGYNGVTMEAIAEAAPVSKPTLYNHFTDKGALFFAVMEERSQKMFRTFQENLEVERSLEDTLKGIGHTFLDIILKPETLAMFRIMIGEGVKYPELGQLFYEVGPKRTVGLLADYFKKLDSDGQLNVPNPEMSANFFLNMIKGYPHMQCLMGLKKKVPQDERDYLVNYAVSIFLNGHKKP